MGYTVSATAKAGAKIPVCSKAHAKKFIQNLYYLSQFDYKYDERLGLIQLKDQNETALIE